MDWLRVAEVFALAAGVVALVAALVVATLVWFLNHPKD